MPEGGDIAAFGAHGRQDHGRTGHPLQGPQQLPYPNDRPGPRSPGIAQILERHSSNVDAPSLIWGAEITLIWTDDRFLQVAGVKDLHSRKIDGWSMEETMTNRLVEVAPTTA